MDRQKIALLGSTGSIGEQTLDIARQYSDIFQIETLTTNNRWERVVEQALEFQPDNVVVANEQYYKQVVEALSDQPIKVYCGSDAISQVVRSSSVDVVVNALVGYVGLQPTVAAIECGKKLALANKESLVVAGEMVMSLAAEHKAPIIPIDSEHSAIFQCLVGEMSPLEKLIITASGGPFRDWDISKFKNITVEQALKHPNWVMGKKITIDSATMLNKGFEVIEAKWLFDVSADQIEVVVHPQSIIHSMVEFRDGAIKAQLGNPDMHLPIQYALTFPIRLPSNEAKFSFSECRNLTFEAPDMDKFPALRLAYQTLERGGTSGCTLNAANEVAVAAFLDKKIGFMDIPNVLEYTLDCADWCKQPTIDQYDMCNQQGREIAIKWINNNKK